MSTFVVTPDNTGRDVLERVSEAESECIRSEIGDASYDTMLNAGLLAVGRGSDAVQTVFTCLNPDNFVLFSTAVIDAQNGGLPDATRACILDLGRDHEGVMSLVFGVDTTAGEASSITEVQAAATEVYSCMSDREKVELTVRLWNGIAGRNPPDAEHIVAALTEAEINCYMQNLNITREQLVALTAGVLSGALPVSGSRNLCLTPETNSRIFASTVSAAYDGLSAETEACMAAFALEHPDYVALTTNNACNPEAMSESEFIEIADDGLQVLGCVTEDELGHIQAVLAEVLRQPPASAT